MNRIKITLRSGTGAVIASVLASALCQGAVGQEAQGKDAKAPEIRGLPPRATPADYQAHAQAGAVTLAAEFTGHSVVTPGAATLATEDYVVVEVGMFGPPEARATLSGREFSLRINGKKTALAEQPYSMIFGSLKDPEWEPPEVAAEKSKTSIGSSGEGQPDPTATPRPVHVPITLERTWEQRVQKASLPEGERTLPAAGLIFFKYHGKSDDIDTIELTYAGSAGKALLKLHP